jgi:hypothetical protein
MERAVKRARRLVADRIGERRSSLAIGWSLPLAIYPEFVLRIKAFLEACAAGPLDRRFFPDFPGPRGSVPAIFLAFTRFPGLLSVWSRAGRKIPRGCGAGAGGHVSCIYSYMMLRCAVW